MENNQLNTFLTNTNSKQPGKVSSFDEFIEADAVEIPLDALEAVSGGASNNAASASGQKNDNVLYSIWKKIKNVLT